MRTCGPSAMFSANEASNQQEALFYSKRLPLLTRIYLSMHFYDNRSPMERERLKFQYWRTNRLDKNGFHNNFATTKKWLDRVALSNRPEKWRHVADAYIKEFAFVLNEQNERIQDLDAIVALCRKKNVALIYHLLPATRDYAQYMFGNTLLQYMDHNARFLVERYERMGVTIIDNYRNSNSVQYTDQWYPTEHMNGTLRRNIAKSIAAKLSETTLKEFAVEQNNWPNPNVHQPMADTLLRTLGIWESK